MIDRTGSTILNKAALSIQCSNNEISFIFRRTRRKSIIRVTDSSGRRVEFLRSRSLERRSQSFDEGITNFAKHDTKFCQESTPRDDRYSRRIDNGGVSREVDTRQKGNVVIKACADVDNELEENPPELVKKHSDVSPVANSVSHLECGSGKNDQLHDSGILCDRRDEDLENCSVSCLNMLSCGYYNYMQIYASYFDIFDVEYRLELVGESRPPERGIVEPGANEKWCP